MKIRGTKARNEERTEEEKRQKKKKTTGSGREEYKKREGKYGREWFQLDLFPLPPHTAA
jgi:hypothetical protein